MASSITIFILVLLSSIVICSNASASDRQKLIIRYQAANALKSESRIGFDRDLLLSLEQYTSPYQDLKLVKINTEMPPNRAFMEVANNGHINIIISPLRSDLPQQTKVVNVPLLKGLLGFRQLVVTKKTNQELKAIKSVNDLKQYKLGQVGGWIDVDILRNNGFKVHEAANLGSAFRMLNGNRFDLLPLGIIEVDKEYEPRVKNFPNMEVSDSFFIYYPLPVMIHVSPGQTELYLFLKTALQKMIEDGRLETLIKRHFGMAVATLTNSKAPIFEFTNSNLPKDITMDNTTIWLSNRFQQ